MAEEKTKQQLVELKYHLKKTQYELEIEKMKIIIKLVDNMSYGCGGLFACTNYIEIIDNLAAKLINISIPDLIVLYNKSK